MLVSSNPEIDQNSGFQARLSGAWIKMATGCLLVVAVAFSVTNSLHAEDVADAAIMQQLEEHLTVGEFGPAMDLANSAQSDQQKSNMLAKVAAAQTNVGNFKGAMSAARQIAIPEIQESATREARTEQNLAGGSGADFSQLINLIQESVGTWEDTEGEGGTITPYGPLAGGVSVDPAGLLKRVSVEEKAGRLQALGLKARKADLNDDMSQVSNLRMVSLTRLEKEIAERLKNGQTIPESMKRLAGLHSVKYLFVYPEEGEVVLAGPAEGWEYDLQGQTVGSTTGQPILQLDDLVTVMRVFSEQGDQKFHCSIEPRQEGLKKLKSFVDASSAPLKRGTVGKWVKQLERELGRQDTVFEGVPADSRVARVIIEADYRMKLIGVGKLAGAPGMASYFDLLSGGNGQNGSQLTALRWWMTPAVSAINHSGDHTVHELVGSSVKCLSENELVNQSGIRTQTGQAEPSNEKFARLFTEHYTKLAENELVFADLQNVFDLSLVASILHEKRLADASNWNYGVFAAEGGYETASFNVPQQLESVGNFRRLPNREIAVQVAGGVNANVSALVKDSKVMKSTTELDGLARNSRSELPEGRWWWDAAAVK